MQVAFGKASVRSGSAQGGANSRLPPPATKLTAANLSKLNGGRSGSVGGFKRQIDPDVQVFTGEENKQEAGPDAEQTPVQHKNYGKVPAYLNKYKAEFADQAA